MIDTVILTIPRHQIISLPKNDRDSPKWELNSKSESFVKYVINQTTKQKKDGIYRPRLRGIQRGRASFLQIEFSVPKLLLGNNVNEVSADDFDKVVAILNERIQDFNLGILTKTLADAEVSVFHPSKNILLKDGYTASFIIKELQKINLNLKMDLTKNKFSNDGELLQCYANSHSLVIYDKMRDIKKPKGRAIDKDQTNKQLSLFEKISTLEVLRIEVRLSNKAKMNKVLGKIGVLPTPTFRDLFKNDICQKIVAYYWKEIIQEKNQFIFTGLTDPQEILQKITKEYPNLNSKQSIYLAGLHILARDKDGIRGLRNIIESRTSRRTWYRLTEDLNKLNNLDNNTLHDWVWQVDAQLKDFKPIKLST